ncbi:MAG: type II toxin-antitoxin system RelE/ParE family toxin [Caldilinea sp. CFX5]|nr:type II toxin-antitoxin system RelE/ParE family toxin [Caldilinea sp. CFX5]
MKPYQLDIPELVRRQIRRVRPDRMREEVVDAILALPDEPYPPGSQLQDELRRRYRLRINGWRIIYKVDDEDQKITILAVRHRNRRTYLTVP